MIDLMDDLNTLDLKTRMKDFRKLTDDILINEPDVIEDYRQVLQDIADTKNLDSLKQIAINELLRLEEQRTENEQRAK